jgi:hypothetical protein
MRENRTCSLSGGRWLARKRATSDPTLQLYSAMKERPVESDLKQLWSKLGVEVEGRTITFNDGASWASVRRAIAADR